MIWIGRTVAALTGIILGVWAAILYEVVSLRKRITAKAYIAYPDGMSDGEREAVEKVVRRHKRKFRATGRFGIIRSISGIKDGKKRSVDLFSLVEEIAAIMSPASAAPLLELSERQIFDFIDSCVWKVRTTLDESGVKALKNADLSEIITPVKAAAAALGNKGVKAAQKAFKSISFIINFINPFFWLKKGLTALVYGKIVNEIGCFAIDVVARETSELYAAGVV